MWDSIWYGASVATMRGDALGLVPNGAVAVERGRIAWVGPTDALPGRPEVLARAVHDCAGALVTPGLIDAHTHLVFGGDRIGEFIAALHGATRAELAAAGGGILATVRATRAADDATLLETARAAGVPDGGRRHHGRDQVGLWPGPRYRAQDAARRATIGHAR